MIQIRFSFVDRVFACKVFSAEHIILMHVRLVEYSVRRSVMHVCFLHVVALVIAPLLHGQFIHRPAEMRTDLRSNSPTQLRDFIRCTVFWHIIMWGHQECLFFVLGR